MAANIIEQLSCPQRKGGVRCLSMGKPDITGRPQSAANRAYPNVLHYLRALIALSIPHLDSTQATITVVRGTTSEWHTTPR
eukprot:3572721-Amphidinium_carterae.1